MIQYPKHPRAVVSKRSAYGKRVVAAACRRQLATDSSKHLSTYSAAGTSGNLVGVKDLWQLAFGDDYQLWAIHAYASDLAHWEIGERLRRPSSVSIKMSEARFIEYVDQIHEIFCHWVSLVEAARSRGVTGTGHWSAYGPVFNALPSELVQELNDMDAGVEGVEFSKGGPDQNKRPPETRPEIRPLFDDELAAELGLACDKQRTKPIMDGRTVQDCLYFPLADVIDHLRGNGMSTYVLDRLRWLVGAKERRPQWGALAKPAVMRDHDDFAARLLGHWLALHEALSPTGEIGCADAETLLFHERILLTDVESLSSRDELLVIQEARQAYQVAMKSARGRLSGLAERATLRVA